jgi:hypothetical protein
MRRVMNLEQVTAKSCEGRVGVTRGWRRIDHTPEFYKISHYIMDSKPIKLKEISNEERLPLFTPFH